MIRRINHTGRVKLPKDRIRISLVQSGKNICFDAQLDLSEFKLPGDASVFVEAYRQSLWVRFPWGTVANLQPPKDRRISQFEVPEGILFRVKVTATSRRSYILAEADKISVKNPEEEAGRESLLDVVPNPELEEQVWGLKLEGKPLLEINPSVAIDWRQFVRSPMFMSLVYPSVVREILTRILLIDRDRDFEDEDDWKAKWLQFARALPGVNPTIPTDEDETHQWIEDAVGGFCRHLKLNQRLKHFLESGDRG